MTISSRAVTIYGVPIVYIVIFIILIAFVIYFLYKMKKK